MSAMKTISETQTPDQPPLPHDQKVRQAANRTRNKSADTMNATHTVKSQNRKDSKVTDLGETKDAVATPKVKATSKNTPPPTLKAVTTALSKQDLEHIAQLESRVDQAPLTSFRAIAELETYKDGIAWKGHDSFNAYAKSRFGFSVSHAGRALASGRFVKRLEERDQSEMPVSEIQVRYVLGKIPESHQPECWEKIAPKGSDPKKMTGRWVKDEVSTYLQSLPPAVQALKPPRAAKKGVSSKSSPVRLEPRELLSQLQESTANLINSAEIRELLEKVERLIAEGTAIHVDSDGSKSEPTETGEPALAA